MKRPTSLVVVSAIFFLMLPGCPGAAGLGVWIVLHDGDPTEFGLEFAANGDVMNVDTGNNASLAGTLTWVRISDTEILIRQSVGGDLWIYYGELNSATTISGGRQKVVGSGAGTGLLWSAVRM